MLHKEEYMDNGMKKTKNGNPMKRNTPNGKKSDHKAMMMEVMGDMKTMMSKMKTMMDMM